MGGPVASDAEALGLDWVTKAFKQWISLPSVGYFIAPEHSSLTPNVTERSMEEQRPKEPPDADNPNPA